MAFSLKKYFQNFNGISYRTPELLRDSTYATSIKNVRLSENFSLSKRRGYQTLANGVGGAGALTYNNTNLGTGTATIERLLVTDVLSRIVVSDVTVVAQIDSPDTLPSCSISHELDASTQTFVTRIYEDAQQVFEFYSGTGLEETPITLADLKAAVDALPKYTLNLSSGLDTLPAALIPILPESTIVASDSQNAELSIPYETVVAINSVGSFIPFSNHWSERNNPTWELASSTQLHDVVYITTSEDGLMKYDGSLVYKAGLLKPEEPILNNALTPNTQKWTYRVLYTHTDNKENFTQSEISEPLVVDALSSPDISVDISTILDNGYDTDDSRFKIELYRTIADGTVFYLVDTKLASDAVSGIISFDDEDTPDDDLGLEYVFPLRNPVPPPKCRYIDSWRNQIVLTGDPQAVNTVYVADIEGIEGFDSRNSFLTGSRFGGPNSGIRSLDNHLYVFKVNAINMVTGDINAGATAIQIDTIADDGIGALSHHSVIESLQRLYFVSRNGVYSINQTGLKAESDALVPLFTRYTFRENRVYGFNWINENKLLFLLPEFEGNGVSRNSNVIVLDLIAQSWSLYDNLDFSEGISLDGQNLWFVGGNKYSEILNLKSEQDYADHHEAVEFVYKSHWETVGEPSIPKKFNRLKVYTLDTELQTFDSSNFSLDVTTQHDYNDVDISVISMSFGSTDDTGWGNGPWGEFEWGEFKKLTDTKRLAAQKCQAMRTSFSNSVVHQNVLISGFEIEITAPYAAAIKDGR